jgi:large subunit ribosomal protein L18e
MRDSNTPNPELIKLIRYLKKQGREKQANIWLDVAEHLSKPSRQRIAVNLTSINRNTKKADTIVVPGKILGTGNLNHTITVAAFDMSGKAREKLKAAKATSISIPDLVEKNPKGSNIKIIR